MSGIVTEKSPWSEWTIEKQTAKGKYGTDYLAFRTQGDEKTYSSIRIIPVPGSQDDIDFAVRNGISSDDNSLNMYFLSIANEFMVQIQAVQGLSDHKNIVRYEDCLIQKKEGDVGYHVYVRSEVLQPLSEYLRRNKLSNREIAALGTDICSAISLCAANGIVHKDIKPSNLFMSDSGDFKLGNFGMDLFQKMSGTGNGATLAYMAPELSHQGAVFSDNTDTYSLGLVLYWLLNDRALPFFTSGAAGFQDDVIGRRLSGEPIPSPSSCDDEILEAIVMKEIGFLPADRFRSAQVFRTALTNYLEGTKSGQPAGYAQKVPSQSPQPAGYAQSVPSQSPQPAGYAQSVPSPSPQPAGYVQNMPLQNAQPAGYAQNMPSQYAQPTGYVGKPKKKHTAAVVLIVAGIVVFLVVAVLAVLFFLGRFSGDTSSKSVESDTSAETVVIAAEETDDISSDEVVETSSEEEEIEPDPDNTIPVKKATCSKHSGDGKYNRKYGANMAVDGNPETCWMAYGKPAGKGNWIKLDFGEKTTVTGIKIINGNTWDGVYKGSFIKGYDELYEKNGRLCKYEIEFSDGTKISGKAADVNESDFSANIIYFDHPIETSYVKLYVKSGYKGYKYANNVCIGEIQAFC
jgi:Serine/threonine protein kinase